MPIKGTSQVPYIRVVDNLLSLSHSVLAQLLANIFREAGVTEADIEGSRISLKRLATRIGTTRLEADTIIEYRNRLREANEAIMVRLICQY
jgi:hypothetical protein